MILPRPTIRLKRDQIFGWHACVEATEVEAVQLGLTGQGLEFTVDYAGAERLGEPGRTDDFANGDWEDVQIELGLKLRRERARTPNRWMEMGRKLRAAFDMPDPWEDEFGNPLPAVTPQASVSPSPAVEAPRARIPASRKVGRNDPCPCGSGKKYKKCCGP